MKLSPLEWALIAVGVLVIVYGVGLKKANAIAKGGVTWTPQGGVQVNDPENPTYHTSEKSYGNGYRTKPTSPGSASW